MIGCRFEGRVALVTAAGAGIGAATARRLAAEGARLVVADLSGFAEEAGCGNLVRRAVDDCLAVISRLIVTRGGLWSRIGFAGGEHRVNPLQQAVAVLLRLEQLEFEQRRLADQVLGALHVLQAGQLDDDAVLTLPLNGRLGDTELVDAVADNLLRPVDGIARLVRLKAFGHHFHDQVNPALEVQAQVDGPFLQVVVGRRTIAFHLLPSVHIHAVELDGRIQVERGSDHEGHDQQGLPVLSHRFAFLPVGSQIVSR